MRALWRYRDLLLAIIERLRKIAPAILEAARARKRLAERIRAGDLDDVLQTFIEAQDAADDYIENG